MPDDAIKSLGKQAKEEIARLAETKRGRGRPSRYTPEIAAELLQRQSEGESLSQICSDKHMPGFATVFAWEMEKPEFSELSQRARMIGTHYLAGDCLRIASQEEDVQRARLMIDTRIRLIGKWNRKDYGEKQTIEHEGLPDQRSTIDVRNLTIEQRDQLRELLLLAQQPRLEGPVTDAEYEEVPEEGE